MRTLSVMSALAVLALLVGCQQGPRSVVVEVEALTVSNATVQAYPQAGGGKAVLMDNDTSRLEGTVALKAGTYQVVVTGMAPDGAQDALDLSVTSAEPGLLVVPVRERICFDEQFNVFVTASTDPPPQISLDRPAKVKLVLSIDDEFGMAVDRVEFRPVVEAGR